MTALTPWRRRSRISHFKAPFVVAVFTPVAALEAGCGARAEQASTEDSARQTAGAPSTPELAVNSHPDCPRLQPAAGSACSANELLCRYGADLCSSDRKCFEGSWISYGPTCNPPPVPNTTCPAEEPAIGTSCAGYGPGLSCEYPYCYDATAAKVRCAGETLLWEALPVPTCNPPAPEQVCSDEMPVHGSDCYDDGQRCYYPGCEGPASSSASCTFGQWSVQYSFGPACNPPAVPSPVCPGVEPVVGNPCAFEGQVCHYGLCGSLEDPGRAASCNTGAWQQLEVPCLPSSDAGVDGGG